MNHNLRHTLSRASLLLALLIALALTRGGEAHAADACAPYSPHSCETIRVNVLPQYCLPFSGDRGGIRDSAGVGTGFTMIDPNTAPLSDQPSGHPSAPSLVDDLVTMTNGQLRVIATKGLGYGRNGVNGVTQTNSQVNALGVGFNPTGQFEVSVRLAKLDFTATPAQNASQQAGVWFGLDEDNYTKLAVYKVGDNVGRVQFITEHATGATVSIQDFRPTLEIADLDTRTVDLALQINAATLSATGQFRIDDGEWIDIDRDHTLQASFISGKALPNAAGFASFAGILASKRSAPEIERLTPIFDDFCVTRIGNIEPQIVADAYTTAEDAPLSVAAADGVLKNDSDPNPGDAMTAVVVSAPAQAAAFNLAPDGAFTYTPKPNFNGADSFTYRANDGTANSAPATVTITVTPVNDAPVALNAAYNVAEDAVLTVKVADGLMSKVSDIDSPASALSIVVVTPPLHGALALNPSGSFTYAPMPDFFGADSFTYAASDGAATGAPATVTLTVNGIPDVPTANDDSYAAFAGETLIVGAATGVLSNDRNPDGGAFSAAVTTPPSSGTLALAADGGFSYTPNAGFVGDDSFTYTATGGAGSDTATVAIQVALAPVELVANGGFETPDAGVATLPADWAGKRLKADLLRCNSETKTFARSGQCAFEFKGAKGENSLLEQRWAEANLAAGDTLILSAQIKGGNVPRRAGQIAVIVGFATGKPKTYALIVPGGTYDYRRYSRTVVLPADATSARIALAYKGAKGRWWADDVSVKQYASGALGLAVSAPASISSNGLRGGN